MPSKIDSDQIGVKLIGRTRSQTGVAADLLDADFTTPGTAIWLKPMDKAGLLNRINSTLSAMSGRQAGRVALQSLRRAVQALPDPPQPVKAAEAPETAMPAIHVLDREKLSIGGFLNEDRSAGHVDRSKPWHGYRILVRETGWFAGFGICGSDSDLWNNLGEGLGTAPGPNLWGYGQAGVIDNHGGTGAEIERERAKGMIIEASIGDLFVVADPVIGDVTYRLRFAKGWGREDRHNIEFDRVVAE
jgi:hypothetical protein